MLSGSPLNRRYNSIHTLGSALDPSASNSPSLFPSSPPDIPTPPCFLTRSFTSAITSSQSVSDSLSAVFTQFLARPPHFSSQNGSFCGRFALPSTAVGTFANGSLPLAQSLRARSSCPKSHQYTAQIQRYRMHSPPLQTAPARQWDCRDTPACKLSCAYVPPRRQGLGLIADRPSNPVVTVISKQNHIAQ